MENLSGLTIKGYELTERIGAGGFGAVYLAEQSTVGRQVAVKIILPGYANQPDFIRRFETEAQLIARLEHIHIVPLYDFWRDPSGAYLVMRWLRGGSLRDTLMDRPYDLEATAALLDQVASGLTQAHRNNVIHRDIKPSNILLDEEGNAYLSDFGIAKALKLQDIDDFHADRIVGSPDYLSPEQARGEPVTERSDIYSLGVTLFELLTGRHPFPGLSSVERLFKHINEPLPDIADLDESVREGINEVIQKATAKNPTHRYRDSLEMTTAFRQAAKLDGQASVVETMTPREQDILALIVDGRSNREIAQELYIELSTVKWYITQIYRKLGVRSRVQAMVRARELQLVVSGPDGEDGLVESTSISIVLPEPTNPYQGLNAFEAADSRHFFGREALVEKILDRLAYQSNGSAKNGKTGRFLAIVGPSGSGKSSLIKAGLIPALWRGGLPGSENWYLVEMVPGERPLDELEVALLRVAANQAGQLRQQLERDKNGLQRVAGLILPNDGSELVLIIDQFEELFTLVENEAEREHFLELISSTVTDSRGRVRVVISLRADFYHRPLEYPTFGELMRINMETVLPLSSEELERAIVRPARQVGVHYEEGLVANILEDVYYQPGGLPLMQYALTELFDQRDGRVLKRGIYEAMGGAVGALAKRAEELYQEQSQEGQEEIRQMFLRLVTIAESRTEHPAGHEGGSEDYATSDRRPPLDTRRRVLRSELLSASSDTDRLEEIIDDFASYRLLSLDHHPATRRPTVEVAHEALLREWERLQAWLEESQVDLSLHRQLGWAAAEWLRAGRDDSFLLRGARLNQFEIWSEDTQLTLSKNERTYLGASIARRVEKEAVEKEQQEREVRLEQRAGRRLKALVAVMALALIVALGLTIVAILFARDANEQRRLTLIRELALSAVASVEADPQLSLLLALEAADRTYPDDGSVLPEVEDALHQALQSHRASIIYPLGGAVAYSPDGKLLAIGDEDGFLSLWDAHSGDVVRELQGHLIRITDLAFSPDGRYLASSSADTLVKIWDVATGRVLANLQGHNDVVDTIDISADGSRLASADREGSVFLWDLDPNIFKPNETVQLSRPELSLQAPGPVNGVALSPDGQRVTGYVPGKSLIIWNAETGEELQEILEVNQFASGLAYGPLGNVIAAASPGAGVNLWDPETGEKIRSLPDSSPVNDLVFSQDGAMLATTAEDSTSAIWDVETGQELINLLGHPKGIGRIALSPEGGLMATSGQDSTMVWDVNPAGSHELFTVFAHEGEIHDVVYNPAGGQIATTGADGAVKIWDSVTGELLRSLAGQPEIVNFPTYSPNGRWLAAANRDGGISIWNADTGQEQLAVFDETQILSAVSFHADGSKLIVGGQEGAVHMFDTRSGERIRTYRQEGNAVLWLEYYSEEDMIGAQELGPSWTSWDVTTGEHLCTNVGDVITWNTDATADGRFIAGANFDATSTVWLRQEGEPCDIPVLFILRGHTGGVTGVAFNPEGTLLASSGFDGTTRLWDMNDGEQLLTLTGHETPVNGVDISPDGRYLATAGADGMLRVYILSVEELIEKARSRVTRNFTDEECEQYLHLPRCLDE